MNNKLKLKDVLPLAVSADIRVSVTPDGTSVSNTRGHIVITMTNTDGLDGESFYRTLNASELGRKILELPVDRIDVHNSYPDEDDHDIGGEIEFVVIGADLINIDKPSKK